MTVAFLLACVGVSFVLQTRKVKLVRVKPKQNTKTFSIVVHGGAYTIPNDLKLKAENGCRAAALAGARILQKNGSAMDAVEAAVNALELNPVFDAGVGSVLTSEGNIEMDAAIMNGRTLEAGAVACVTSVRNPISLARKVAEKTSHVMLVGHGADKFAEKIRIPKCSLGDLATAAARAELLAFQGYDHVVENVFRAGHDTVGAVAMDGDGNIAAGTSTGGITASMPGRIGDSSIIGSGLYADNASGGVSATGHGESLMKICASKRCVDNMEKSIMLQANPTEAIQEVLENMKARVGGHGGMIAISRRGNVGHACTTSRMSWASIQCESTETEGSLLMGYSGVEPDEFNAWSQTDVVLM